MGTEEKNCFGICGLCLKICDDNKTIGEMKDVLDIVLPKIDLTVIQELVMCKHCTERLQKCFDFKAMCVYTYDYIVPLVNEEKVKLDLKVVYLSKNQISSGVPEDQNVCGFCTSPVRNCLAISIDVEKEADIILKKMIEQCLPELDLSIIEKPVICAPCHESLSNCFRFVSNCLIVEERIKKYCESMTLNRKDGIDLSSFIQFAMSNIKSEVDGNSLNILKREKIFCEENESELNEGNLVDMKEQKFLIQEEIEIKTDEQDISRFDDGVAFPQPEVATKLCKRERCLVPNLKENFPCVKRISTNKDVTMHKCDFCSYQTNNKQTLKRHLLTHKDPSEITMYKCDSCSFQAKRKGYLKKHLLVHNDTRYKCGSCSYQSKYKDVLVKHLLAHQHPSEVTVYKCDSCSFETNRKISLQTHLLVHKSHSVTMYKCDSCPYQTKDKYNLKNHLVLHKDPSEVTMYKCDSCSHQTIHKRHLKAHSLVHKNPSEVKMYKCDSCSYQTKYRSTFKRHLLVHKDRSEVTMYKCDSCLFQTKHRNKLNTHLLIHKDPSEVKMYKCDSCSYQTKYRSTFKRHLLVHKDRSEVTMYKCDSCSYQTKHRNKLNTHLLVHKGPSEVTMYKCDLFISDKI